MTPIQLALVIVALILAVVELAQSRARSLLAWGVGVLALALLLGAL